MISIQNKWFRNNKRINCISNTLLNHLNEYLISSNKNRIRILDVGTGDGKISSILMNKNNSFDIVGIDTYKWETNTIPVKLFNGKVIPYKNNEFDFVLINDVFHHANEPELLFDECVRVSSNLIIKDHMKENLYDYLVLKFLDIIGNSGFGVTSPCNYFSKIKWFKLFQKNNLHLLSIVYDIPIYPKFFQFFFGGHRQFIARLTKNKTN